MGRVAKNGIINKRGVPSIRNSRVEEKTIHYGLQYVRHLDSKIWELVPKKIKCCSSLIEFKKKKNQVVETRGMLLQAL